MSLGFYVEKHRNQPVQEADSRVPVQGDVRWVLSAMSEARATGAA